MTQASENHTAHSADSADGSAGAESVGPPAVYSTEKPPGKLKRLTEKLQRSRPMRANTHLNSQGGGTLAAGMSFQALFAIFAALWVGFAVFGFILRQQPALLKTIVTQLDTMVPGLVGKDGAVSVDTLLDSNALSWSSIIAAASLLFLVITWFTSTRTSIRLLFDMETTSYENPVLLKLRDFTLAIVFGLLIVLSAGITVVGSSVMANVLQGLGVGEDSWLFGWAGAILRYGLMFASYWFVLWAIHRFLAQVPVRGRRLWLGCLPGAVGLLILTVLGTSVLGGATKNPLLKSFVVIIALLLWFNFICRILLLTSSWIACGRAKDIGLPAKLAAKDREERERIEAITRAGVDRTQAADLDPSLLEPYARAHGDRRD